MRGNVVRVCALLSLYTQEPHLKSPPVQPLVRNLKRQVQGAWENCGKSVHTDQPSLAPSDAHLWLAETSMCP